MAVDVKINGKGPYKLIFDTGAPVSLLNTKTAEAAGVEFPEEVQALPLFGKVGQGKIKKMEVGGATAADLGVVVMDHPTVTAISQALKKDIAGLVGFPFFAQFKMTLDYQTKKMTLTPNGYKPKDVMGDMMSMMMDLLKDPKQVKPKMLAPSAQWGVVCAKDGEDESDGVDVKAVVPDSAADKAGIKKGDRLLTLDGRWTDSMADLYEAAGYVKPGTKVKVKVKRDKKEMELEVTPAKGM